MSNRTLFVGFCPATLLALAAIAHGQTEAFNNFAPGMTYNTGTPSAAVYGPQASNWAHGILFTAEASGGITGLNLALRHSGGVNDFVARIQADNNGFPGTILGLWDNIQGLAVAGDPPIHVSADGSVHLEQGVNYWMVVWGNGNAAGNWHRTTLVDPGTRGWGQQGGTNWSFFQVPSRYAFRITVEEGSACYANCDGSVVEPVLNVDDFTCFINEFAAATGLPHEQQVSHYANCDSSTTAPALNVDDFTCFINAFAVGCS
jgi:hypothetical protein